MRPLTEIGDVEALSDSDPEQIIALDTALTKLETEDPEAAAIVRLRFFAGLSVEQAAEAMGVSARSADLVAGDIIALEPGDKVPADLRLLQTSLRGRCEAPSPRVHARLF